MIGVYLKFNMLDFVLCLLCLYQRLSAGGVCSITQQSPSQGGGEGGEKTGLGGGRDLFVEW